MAIINGSGDDERLFGTNAADTINARAARRTVGLRR